MSRARMLAAALMAAALGVAVAPARAGIFTSASPLQRPPSVPLQHLVFIVQENRSFDHLFGTFPGADGLPNPPVCQVSQWYPSACFTPWPNHLASNQGGPYAGKYQTIDVDNGAMNGFVLAREKQLGSKCAPPGRRFGGEPQDAGTDIDEGIHTKLQCTIDVMGYHTQSDIPNYWSYASSYVLFDHFFESVQGYSLPSHLALFSGWAAVCKKLNPPQINSCITNNGGKLWGAPPNEPAGPTPYLWTDITYMLHQNGVSWAVYLDNGLDPLTKPFGLAGVQLIWDVLPG